MLDRLALSMIQAGNTAGGVATPAGALVDNECMKAEAAAAQPSAAKATMSLFSPAIARTAAPRIAGMPTGASVKQGFDIVLGSVESPQRASRPAVRSS